MCVRDFHCGVLVRFFLPLVLVLLVAAPAAAQDGDGDGVADTSDLCPATAAGEAVDADGCSLDQLCPCAGPASGGTWRNHGEYVACVADAADQLVAAGALDRRERGQRVHQAAESECGHADPGDGGGDGGDGEGTPDEHEVEDSLGNLHLEGVSETGFNPRSGTLSVRIEGAELSIDPADHFVILNGRRVPPTQTATTSEALTVSYLMDDGRNDLIIAARDTVGFGATLKATLWAGRDALGVEVVDEAGSPIDGARVTVRLSDDREVAAVATTGSDGRVQFGNIPFRTLVVTGEDAAGRIGTAASVGGHPSLRLILHGFEEASLIDNNDFGLGLEGWEVGTAPVQLIPHVEDSTGSSLTATASSTTDEDLDLELSTSGEGPQSLSRTFVVKPGTKSVSVRYRFITSEVPGGFFGTEFNDYFSVSIRSIQGGGNATETDSMNGLGLSAFDAGGATAWREVEVPVDVEGDTVQVDVTVANVADGLFDSQVVVDRVDEKAVAITSLELFDINNEGIDFLSADSPHPYYGSNTRIHGKIRIEGPSEESLDALVLEVLQGGGVVATANLVSDLEPTLLQAFGDDETIELTSARLVFELPAAQAANVDGNGSVTLRARAITAAGDEATRAFDRSLRVLVRYQGTNRYGVRDEDACIGRSGPLDTKCGGDDWVLSEVRTVMQHFTGTVSGMVYGDVSNMNGGPFPIHGTHQLGEDVDGGFPGYNDLNAGTAAKIIEQLNDATHGSSIALVYVTYTDQAGDPFHDAIQGVELDDGRMATDHIAPLGGHRTHFHWIVRP